MHRLQVIKENLNNAVEAKSEAESGDADRKAIKKTSEFVLLYVWMSKIAFEVPFYMLQIL